MVTQSEYAERLVRWMDGAAVDCCIELPNHPITLTAGILF